MQYFFAPLKPAWKWGCGQEIPRETGNPKRITVTGTIMKAYPPSQERRILPCANFGG